MASKPQEIKKTLKRLRFGVEVEMIKLRRETAARVVAEYYGGTHYRSTRHNSYLEAWLAKMPDGREWAFVRDASQRDTGDETNCEVVTPIMTWDDIRDFQAILRLLREAGGRAGKYGGVHCHVGVESFSTNQLRNVVKIFYRLEPLLFKAVGTQEWRRSQYCRPTDERFMDQIADNIDITDQELSRAYYQGHESDHHYNSRRYFALNLHCLWSIRTVEFRFGELHKLHAGKIKAFIHLCLGLAAQGYHSGGTVRRRRQVQNGNDKYALRIALNAMGMVGGEFKNTRAHLLEHLEGHSAYASGRKPRHEDQD